MYMNNLSDSNDPITAIGGQECSFKINYGKTKESCFNYFIRSPTFMRSGYEWSMRYYPRGSHGKETSEYISLYLDLESQVVNVSASVIFHLLGEDSRPLQSRQVWSFFHCKKSTQGFHTFIKRSLLESEFVRDGCFVLSCDIRVLNGEWERTSLPDEIPTPPIRYLHGDLQELLKSYVMTDVVIDVEGVEFKAHRLVLAARSPVFKEYFTKAGTGWNRIEVKYISPVVFKVLLHFMYTDSLLPVHWVFDVNSAPEDLDLYELIQKVLVAADRYKLLRLKLICEEKLAKHISMETVVASLDLAHHHGCQLLKEVCLEFGNKPENITELMQSDGYVKLMERCPALLAEFMLRDIHFPPPQKLTV